MRTENQIRPRVLSRTKADYVSDFVDPDILKAEIGKQTLEFLAPFSFLERRRGNFADANLFLNKFDSLRWTASNAAFTVESCSNAEGSCAALRKGVERIRASSFIGD